MRQARIASTGMHVPDQVVTNQDLAELMDTSDAWIRKRTGIRERRFAPEGIYTSELAVPAAEQAIGRAGLEPRDIDHIIFATLSPDHHFPGAGCYFQARMGLEGVPVLDVRNQCSGFLYGLAVASAFVQSGLYGRVLLVGSEIHSHALDFSDEGRDVSVLFGDGAGVAVVSEASSEGGGRIHSHHLHADGRHAEALCLKVWDISRKPYIQHDGQYGLTPPHERWPHMNGREVFKHAVTGMSEAIMEACRHNGVSPADIDLVVPHQANRRINEMVGRTLKIPEERVVHTIDVYGNTTAASIPMALHVAQEDGRLQPGMKVMLVGFGSGFTWGASLLTW